MVDINFRDAGVYLLANRMVIDYRLMKGVEIEGFVQDWTEQHVEDLTQEYKDDVFEKFMTLVQL